MVNMEALMRALPISELEPSNVAFIDRFIETQKEGGWRGHVLFLEPPAGQRVPYIEPVKALSVLLCHQGVDPEAALARAREAALRMTVGLEESTWVHFLDDLEPDSPACLPVPDFIAWLRAELSKFSRMCALMNLDAETFKDLLKEETLVRSDTLDFLQQAAEVSTSTPMFRGRDNWDEPWALQALPAQPPPEAMIEFMPGAPWIDIDGWGDWKVTDNPFLRWREAIRPVAQAIESTLGESVYHFADWQDEFDDDAVHRFLVLHWCCTYKPESAYVRFLLKVSGARDVEELKAALIDPANYTTPFKMNDAFITLEPLPCRIDYVPQTASKTVAVVFSTAKAREAAQALLAQKINVHARIIAPKALASDEWVSRATRHCRDWQVSYLHDGKINAIETLASIDELCVIADEKTPTKGFDLKLPEAVEDLLWQALQLRVKARYFHIDRTELMNPETCLQKSGAPKRVALLQAQRIAFTRQLTELRLECAYGSSGLTDADGGMLGYDQLDLPFPLVRRVAAWQRAFDDAEESRTVGNGSGGGLRGHTREAVEIAKALQATLGSNVVVTRVQGEDD